MHTGVQATTLTIGTQGPDFLAFMHARFDKKWVSYEMTAAKYTEAANDFNRYVNDELQKHGRPPLKREQHRTAQAVMNRLSDLETEIIGRIVQQDFLTVTAKKKQPAGA